MSPDGRAIRDPAWPEWYGRSRLAVKATRDPVRSGCCGSYLVAAEPCGAPCEGRLGRDHPRRIVVRPPSLQSSVSSPRSPTPSTAWSHRVARSQKLRRPSHARSNATLSRSCSSLDPLFRLDSATRFHIFGGDASSPGRTGDLGKEVIGRWRRRGRPPRGRVERRRPRRSNTTFFDRSNDPTDIKGDAAGGVPPFFQDAAAPAGPRVASHERGSRFSRNILLARRSACCSTWRPARGARYMSG